MNFTQTNIFLRKRIKDAPDPFIAGVPIRLIQIQTTKLHPSNWLKADNGIRIRAKSKKIDAFNTAPSIGQKLHNLRMNYSIVL